MMKPALTLLLESFTAELDRRSYRAPDARAALTMLSDAAPTQAMQAFGEFVVSVMGYNEERTAHALDAVDAARIFDMAEVTSLDPFGHRTSQTDAIDKLWQMIVDRLPEPEWTGHEAGATGYYGRSRFERKTAA